MSACPRARCRAAITKRPQEIFTGKFTIIQRSCNTISSLRKESRRQRTPQLPLKEGKREISERRRKGHLAHQAVGLSTSGSQRKPTGLHSAMCPPSSGLTVPLHLPQTGSISIRLLRKDHLQFHHSLLARVSHISIRPFTSNG